MNFKPIPVRAQFERIIHDGGLNGIRRATVIFHNETRALLNVSNPRNRKTGKYDRPSSPGEAPRARTGFGRDNVYYEIDQSKPAGRVGERTNGIYIIYHQLGINYRQAGFQQRPSFSEALEKKKSLMAAAIKVELAAALRRAGK